ncbi:MAG: lipocalin-like domain-containing protein [Muribaculaceae bacterium]|nr:lipocalin-like domain-containing protein [Muribaculaceae bacterium]
MTRKYSLLLILIIGLLQLGCTRNNGDIGDLFGTWRLDTLTEDGKELDLYGGMTKVYTWAFQSHIIRVQDIRNNMDHSNCYGTWIREENFLILDFTHKNDSGTTGFHPPVPLHFDSSGITKLTVEHLSSRKMQVSYKNADDVEYVYHLRKVP